MSIKIIIRFGWRWGRVCPYDGFFL